MKSKLAVLLALLAAGVATAAFAAPTTYTFDPNHSFVRFGYAHFGFSHQQSQFNKVSGTVTFDPAAKSGSADVVIDIKSVDTGGSPLAEHLQGTDFFDAAKYPTATFKATALRFQGDKPVSLEGNLTIKGITHPVTLTINHFKQGMNMMKRPQIGADATGTVKRSAFGLGKLAPMVDDNVVLTVDFEAAAAPAG